MSQRQGKLRLRRSSVVRLVHVGLAAICTLSVVALYLLGFSPLEKWEWASTDLRFRLRGQQIAPSNVVVLATDDAPDGFLLDAMAQQNSDPDAKSFLLTFKDRQLPRATYAKAIEKLADAGARVIALDILFLAENSETPADNEKLKQTLSRHADRAVVGANFTADGQTLEMPADAVLPDSGLEKLVGYVNYWSDRDGVIRSALYQTYHTLVAGVADKPHSGDEILTSFDGLAAKKFRGDVRLPSWQEQQRINFVGGEGSFKRHSLHELFDEKAWKLNLKDGSVFKDKIVLLGACANRSHDRHPTPFGVVSGVEIHAASIITILEGNAPTAASRALSLGLVLAMGFLAGLVLMREGNPFLKLVPLAVIGVVYCVVAQVTFNRSGMFLPLIAPLTVLFSVGVSGMAAQAFLERRERAHIRSTFGRYVSKQVVEEILKRSDEHETHLGGERRQVTILFSDVRGFTSIFETADPLLLVGQLNEYFTAMVEIVMKNNGTLDKFIGDAVMAVYGAPLSQSSQQDAWNAVKSSFEMRERLAELQAAWKQKGWHPIQIGIGLNSGEVVSGNIGSPQRMEYTVIGDAVNLASRMEGLTKEFKTDILMSESVYQLVADKVVVRDLGEASVKGREKKVRIYALDGLKP